MARAEVAGDLRGGRERTDRPGIRAGDRRYAPGPRRSISAAGILSPRVGHRPGQGSLVHCRWGEVDLAAGDTIVAASGAGGRPLPGTGRFLPCGRARLCPGGLEHFLAGSRAETLGDSTTASFVARRTEGVHSRKSSDFARGKRGKGWSRERDYLLRNARAGRLDYSKARWAKMPMGSGSMESAVRRVINLRLKGPGIFWHEEHAEQMLHVAGLLQVETLASPDEQSLCNPADQCRITGQVYEKGEGVKTGIHCCAAAHRPRPTGFPSGC